MFKSIRKCFGQSRKRKRPSAELDITTETALVSKDTGRTLLMDSPVVLGKCCGRRKRHLFLFSDSLLITNTKYKEKHKIPLSTIWTASCMDQVRAADTGAQRSFVLGWSSTNVLATFSSSDLQEKWLSLLQRHIELAKEKDQPQSHAVDIFTEDIKNCAPYVKSDTTNVVTNYSLPTGSEREQRLRNSSAEEEAPGPLIGHEHLNDLTWSSVPEAHLPPQGPEDANSPSPEESPELQGQLTVNPRQRASHQQGTDPGRRRVSKWSLFTSLFRRGDGTHHEKQVPTSRPQNPGQLFAASLTDLCEDEALPGPLLEIMYIMSEKGPLTEGIFRKSPNAKACKVLKDKLNAGETVDLSSESVLVLASVLKDFLRNIKGSIFSQDAYNQWFGLMDEESEGEKIAAAQRLLEQLPRANLALLRHLFGLLRTIQLQASTNQMNAYNLAVCLAPSILCLPSSSGSGLDGNMSNKIGLVQFLIEKGPEIFGDDITALCGVSPMRCEGTEEAECPVNEGPDAGETLTASLLTVGEEAQLAPPRVLDSSQASDPRGLLHPEVETQGTEVSQHPETDSSLADRNGTGDLKGSESEQMLPNTLPEEEALCPLDGHERLSDFTGNNLPDAALLPRAPEDSTSPSSLGSLELQGQFAVKPRHPARHQQDTNPGLRSVSKWSLLTSLSRRGDGTHHEKQVPPQNPGQLFGASLTDLCEDEALPGPLLEIMYIMSEKGPLTEGIFRKSPNAKACKVLKDKLNAGETVDLSSESVLVLASVLKDFLRNIKASIFSQDAYNHWLGLMDEESEGEKIAAAQRLLEQLPRANLALLRHLFGLLRTIQLQASTNQMNAYNLAVCLAPSILCLPSSCSSGLHSEIQRKIGLVQFLIENGLEIFGDDITALCRVSPVHCEDSEETTCLTNRETGSLETPTASLAEVREEAQLAPLGAQGSSQASDPHVFLLPEVGAQVKKVSQHPEVTRSLVDPKV